MSKRPVPVPKPKPNVGRPPDNPEEGPRTRVINVRVTPTTHELLHRAAGAAGVPLSKWLLSLGVRAAKRQRGSSDPA